MQHHLFISFDFIVIETIQKKPVKQLYKAVLYTLFLSYDPIRTVATKFEKDEVYSEKGITLHVFCHLLFLYFLFWGVF